MTDRVESLEIEALTRAEVCQVSLDAARAIAIPLYGELSKADSVLWQVIAHRASQMGLSELTGMSPLLLTDPTKSRIRIARWEEQSGSFPSDAVDTDPDKMLAYWTASGNSDIPPLRVPDHLDQGVMKVAERLNMLGEGPVIYAREEIATVPIPPNAKVHISGGANNANRERIQTALEIVRLHPNLPYPIIATADPNRVLKDPERKVVERFAPDAVNEFELFVASAVDKGFVPEPRNAYGSRYLADGSTYITMHHAEEGMPMIILAPKLLQDEHQNNRNRSGLYNAYSTLLKNGQAIEGLAEPFEFADSDIVNITSTFYGTMAALNNLEATYDLRMQLKSYIVVGDNQPATRKAQAHIIEIGKTWDKIGDLLEVPALRAGLLAV